MSAFSEARDEHIACYGPENDLRLTGLHETAAIDEFTYGVADRGASVRIPHSFVDERPPRLPRGSPAELAGRPVPHHRPHPADDRVGHRAGADRGRVRGVGVKCARPPTGRLAGGRADLRGGDRRRGTRPSRPRCRPGRPGTPRTCPSTASSRSVTGAIVGWVALSTGLLALLLRGRRRDQRLRRRGSARPGRRQRAARGRDRELGARRDLDAADGRLSRERTEPRALRRFGFRVLGTQERIGRLHGVWRDVVLLERRSEVVT